MINYTSLNLKALTEAPAPAAVPDLSQPPTPPRPRRSINPFLLVIALITAAVFAVLLFVLMQKRRSAGAVIVPSAPIVSPTAAEAPTPTLPPTVLPTEPLTSDSARLTPTPKLIPTKTNSLTPTLIPEEVLE